MLTCIHVTDNNFQFCNPKYKIQYMNITIMIGEISLLSYRDVDFYADKKFMSVLAQIPINQTGRNIKVIFCYESLKVK